MENPVLTDRQKEAIESIPVKLSQIDGQVEFGDAWKVMKEILDTHSSSYLTVFFLSRIMILRDTKICENFKEFIEKVFSIPETSYPTIPSKIMSICFLSNVVSHKEGVSYILSDNERTGMFIDVAMRAVSSENVNLRQMAATMPYNLVLALTKGGKLALIWEQGSDRNVESENELNGFAVQIICSIAEEIISEADANVRSRRLAIICRIQRAYGALASTFIEELGFKDMFRNLRQDTSIMPKITTLEEKILDELIS